jgi:hypothetical protein
MFGEIRDQVAPLLEKRTFRLFTIERDDGRSIVVDDPRAFGMNGGTVAFVAAGGRPQWFGAERAVRIALVEPEAEQRLVQQ